ncbi:histidinol-phosphatase [bacterium BFN5]|nr:histidinol-phosphatase [bacterium BFN5]
MKKPIQMLLFKEAWPLAEKIAEYLQTNHQVEQIAVCGAVRRRVEVIHEIELVIASSYTSVLDFARTMPGIYRVGQQSKDSLTAELTVGISLHLYVVQPRSFFPALYFYTATDRHNEQISALAKAQGLSFWPQGLLTKEGQAILITSEEEVCRQLAFAYISPELREGRGEVALAVAGKLPELVTTGDITGGLHVHTSYSDGGDSIKQLITAARLLGWRYLGISDHSQSAHYAGGLKTAAILQQRQEIDLFNSQNPDFSILAGIESDIKPDGSLDYSDDILAQFDFVIASVHSAFKQDEATMTKRIIKAMNNPYVSILGHMTGRMLLKRPGYQVDIPEILAVAAQTGTMIEINANPRRLDLDWRWHSLAKELGVLFTINPDAHAAAELSYMNYGVNVARKGGLSAEDIANTRPIEEIKAMLKRKR